MHVLYVGYGYDAGLQSEADFLERCPTVPAFASAIAAAGPAVTVLQRFSREHSLRFGSTEIAFKTDRLPPRLRWHLPRRFHRAICELAASVVDAVVHVNGLIFPAQIQALRTQLPRGVPIVVQHHAERPCTGFKRTLQRHGLRAADGFLFASSTLAEPWTATNVISSHQPVYEVMESPVTLDVHTKHSPALRGSPVLLWVGRLNAGKDPLTVLAAFEQVVPHFPSARLHMVYAGGELAEVVRDRVRASKALRSKVELPGEVPHRDMPRMYAAADFFVSGSHREGSGYALAEAMAHSLIPVVPRIPSFSTMAGAAAHFWSAGNATDCARAMLEALSQPVEPQQERVRRQYNHFLSPEAVARHAMAAYGDALERRRLLA